MSHYVLNLQWLQFHLANSGDRLIYRSITDINNELENKFVTDMLHTEDGLRDNCNSWFTDTPVEE